MSAYVYRTFGLDGSLLYIGCTGDVARRLGAHLAAGTAGGDQIARISYIEFDTKEEAFAAEADAILRESPPLNRLAKYGGAQRAKPLAPVGLGRRLLAVIEAHMRTKGMTIGQLAEAADIRPGAMASRWVHPGGFTTDELDAVAEALGVQMSSLFFAANEAAA